MSNSQFGKRLSKNFKAILLATLSYFVFSLETHSSCTLKEKLELLTSQNKEPLATKGSINANKALIKPKEIYIDEFETIAEKDPHAFVQGWEIDEIRASSGRLGDLYVKPLPALEGSLKEAFEGPYEIETFKPGRVLWQIQREGAEETGRWFSTTVPKSRDEAEVFFNLEKWNNDRGQMRMYLVKDSFTGYVGKVEGGLADQLYIPDSIPVNDLVEPITYRIVPGGEVVKNLSTLKKGTQIEATIHKTQSKKEYIEQGTFLGLEEIPGQKFKYLGIKKNKGSTYIPLHADSDYTVRLIKPALVTEKKIYPSTFQSFNVKTKPGSYVEVPYPKLIGGRFVEERIRGKVTENFYRKKYDAGVRIQKASGETIDIPYHLIDERFVSSLKKADILKPSILKKDEKFISNLLPGELVKISTLENGIHHIMTGFFEGIRRENYIAIKKVNDSSPVYVRIHEVVDQKAKLVQRASDSATNVHTDHLRKKNYIQVSVKDTKGKDKVLRGIQLDSNLRGETILTETGKIIDLKTVKYTNFKIIPLSTKNP